LWWLLFVLLCGRCCAWAKRNRALIARRFLEQLGVSSEEGEEEEEEEKDSQKDNADTKTASTTTSKAAASTSSAAAAAGAGTGAGAVDPMAKARYRCVLGMEARFLLTPSFSLCCAVCDSLACLVVCNSFECMTDVWHNLVVPQSLDPKIVAAQRAADESKGKAAAAVSASAPSKTPEAGVTEQVWVHRKGATPSDQGLVVIPGSRGDFSYLVLPNTEAAAQHLSCFSLAHGAG
jgi:hypothetical protein